MSCSCYAIVSTSSWVHVALVKLTRIIMMADVLFLVMRNSAITSPSRGVLDPNVGGVVR